MGNVRRDRQYVLLILALAAALRFVGLANRVPSLDEVHYRDEMAHALEMIRNGTFRDHSVRHAFGSAPHGMLGPLMNLMSGRLALAALSPVVPRQDYARDNFCSRVFPALAGVLLVGVGFLLARELFSTGTALTVALLLAISPIQVNWSRSEYLDADMTLFVTLSLLFAWRAASGVRRGHPVGEAALAGALAGLALASKWSAVLLMPFPLAVVAFGALDRSPGSMRRALGQCGAFCGLAALASLSILSLASFKWALFPDPSQPFAVPDFPKTPVLMLVRTLAAIRLDWQRNLAGLSLNWGGPAFLPIMAVTMWLAVRAVRRRGTQALVSRRGRFLLVLAASSAFFFLFSGSSLDSWRVIYPSFALLLLSGYLLEHLTPRRRAWLGATACIAATPITLNYGLRLGPPLMHYFGSELRYSMHLPTDPPMRWRLTNDGKEYLAPTQFVFKARPD